MTRLEKIARKAPLNQLAMPNPVVLELYDCVEWVPATDLRQRISTKAGRSWINDENWEMVEAIVQERCDKVNDTTSM